MLPTILRRNGRPVSLFDEDLGRLLGVQWPASKDDLVAQYPVDIHEDENHIYVDAELPGFEKNEVDVTIENGVLTITAERKSETPKGEKHLNERRYTRVGRSFTVPNTIDPEKVDATLTNGLLKLVLHKHEQVKPRRISLK